MLFLPDVTGYLVWAGCKTVWVDYGVKQDHSLKVFLVFWTEILLS